MKERKRKKERKKRDKIVEPFETCRVFETCNFFSTNFSYLVIQEVNSDEKENSVHEDI